MLRDRAPGFRRTIRKFNATWKRYSYSWSGCPLQTRGFLHQGVLVHAVAAVDAQTPRAGSTSASPVSLCKLRAVYELRQGRAQQDVARERGNMTLVLFVRDRRAPSDLKLQAVRPARRSAADRALTKPMKIKNTFGRPLSKPCCTRDRQLHSVFPVWNSRLSLIADI
jgi:hypothetical protein